MSVIIIKDASEIKEIIATHLKEGIVLSIEFGEEEEDDGAKESKARKANEGKAREQI